MRRLLLSAALLALVVGCGPSPTNQTASPPSNAYSNQPQQPKSGDGKDTSKKEEGK